MHTTDFESTEDLHFESRSVAIITRIKNRPLLLKRAMRSVLDQSYEDWMHVIVNDGGERVVVDALAAEMDSAYRGRIRIVHNLTSVGMEAASNIGLKQSRSKWVALLDDDDTWHPDFLGTCVQALQDKRAPSVKGVVTHSIKVIERIKSNRCVEVVQEVRRETFNEDLRTIQMSELLSGNLFTVNSFLYERDVIQTIGPYREDLSVLGDLEFTFGSSSNSTSM
jgi:glycosyltransferase involved in cell wall biosynthesis